MLGLERLTRKKNMQSLQKRTPLSCGNPITERHYKHSADVKLASGIRKAHSLTRTSVLVCSQNYENKIDITTPASLTTRSHYGHDYITDKSMMISHCINII